MKKIVVLTLLAILIFGPLSASGASLFRQKNLIQKYMSVPETSWDEITKENKELIDGSLLDLVIMYYNNTITQANNAAEKNNQKRNIPQAAFIFANIADYIAGKINKPSQLRFELAQEYKKDGRFDIAADICNYILITDPKNIKVATIKEVLFWSLRMPGEAMSTYQGILDIDKNNTEALYRLGILYINLGRYNEAADLFRQLIKLNPGNETARRYLDLYDGKTDSARNPQANQTAMTHFMAGEKLFYEGKYHEAAEYYAMAIETDPRFYKAYIYLSECVTRQKRYAEAAEILENAIKIDPNKPEAYHYLGLCLEKNYNFNPDPKLLKRAVENYEKALKASPSDSSIKEDLDRAKKRMEQNSIADKK